MPDILQSQPPTEVRPHSQENVPQPQSQPPPEVKSQSQPLPEVKPQSQPPPEAKPQSQPPPDTTSPLEVPQVHSHSQMQSHSQLLSHKIMNMDEEKRNRVINAAMVEFNKGYDKASTDAIVREAGISKGLLFHYFESKEKLYDFLVEYALDIIVREYFELINFEQRDFLERMWQLILLKVDLSYKLPAVFDFVTTVYKEQKSDVLKNASNSLIEDVMPKLFSGIDETLFRDDIDPQMAIKTIYWAQVGYSTTQLEKSSSTDLSEYQKEYERYLEELKAVFDNFRKTFYK